MKKWVNEDWGFELSVVKGNAGHCRLGLEQGDRFAFSYECPAGMYKHEFGEMLLSKMNLHKEDVETMVTLVKAESENKEYYKNVFNIYQNELSLFLDDFDQLDNNGYFDCDTVDEYFQGNIAIIPFVVKSDDKNIGVLVLSKSPYVKKGCDYCIQEFFIIGSCRGKGIATEAINLLFMEYPGKYCFVVIKNNIRAIKFWDKVCGESFNNVNKTERENDYMYMTY